MKADTAPKTPQRAQNSEIDKTLFLKYLSDPIALPKSNEEKNVPLRRYLTLICLIATSLLFASKGAAQDQHQDPFERGFRLYYFEKNYEEALDAYKLVPKDHPMYPRAQRYIGHNVYGREWGQWEKAVPYVEEAFRVAPDDPKVLEDIGRVYLKVGKIAEGIELLERADTWVSRRALQELKEGT